ncbi:MAG: glycosyltransferase family 2 protein [Chloroflexi bacterium]|nr:glycosyltransferase family 2 protein [Chloroflexota bacterium]
MSSNWTQKYIVITPVKNEAEFIEKLIQSIVQQTIKPREWIIVNDGSTDQTEEIVNKYVTKHSWIKLLNREDRGFRQRGKGIVETFYVGFEALTTQDYDFIVKLDGDLSFESTYFESLLLEFARNPKLGIAGGGLYEQPDGKKWVLYTVKNHVRGATKMYRRACFEAIGGLVPAMGWDGIDEWKSLTLGWEVQSFFEYQMFHYRYTGTGTGKLKSRVEEAHGAYYMGYHPLYMIARGIRRMVSQPYVIGGIAMILTFFADWLMGREQLPDPSVIDYVRRTQLRQLVDLAKGKPVYER